MQVLGIRLASVNFFGLFKRPFAYITTFKKLIVFPLIDYYNLLKTKENNNNDILLLIFYDIRM